MTDTDADAARARGRPSGKPGWRARAIRRRIIGGSVALFVASLAADHDRARVRPRPRAGQPHSAATVASSPTDGHHFGDELADDPPRSSSSRVGASARPRRQLERRDAQQRDHEPVMSATITRPTEQRETFACFGSHCTVIVAAPAWPTPGRGRVARRRLLEWHGQFSRSRPTASSRV